MQFHSAWVEFVFLANWLLSLEACSPAPPVARTPSAENRGNPDCNFTTGICNWKNLEKPNSATKLNWISVNETADQDSNLLPQQGSEPGYAWLDYLDIYSYFEKQRGQLESPLITGPKCMTFYFYLHGNYTGFLNIETKQGSKYPKLIFSRYGNHGMTWQRAQVYINITGEYKVIITGTVGDHKARHAPGLDDISFCNQTCDQESTEAKFNCSMRNHRCGWQDKGSSLLMKTEYNQELKRYVLKALGLGQENVDKFYLRSPSVHFEKACFHSSYSADAKPWDLAFLGRLFVFVEKLNDGERFPVWSQNVYYGAEWNDIYVEIVLPFSEYNFIVEGLEISTDFLFRDFSLSSSYENCPTAAEKKLYITQNPSQPQKLSISEQSGYCGSFPNWYLITAVVPSPVFPQTIYVYSKNDFLILNTDRNDTLYGDLLRYFYVANDNRFNQSQAVYTALQDGDGFAYVTEFLPRPILNSTDYGFFVKEFVSIEAESKCEHGWTELAGKCYKLFCEKKWNDMKWNDARIDCLKNEADLASLSNNKLNIAKEYLERVQVRLLGARTVSVGLFKIGQEWKWIDGESYNGSVASKRVTKGRLAWSNEENDWILKAAEHSKEYQDVEGTSDLYFCEKMRENVAYHKLVNQSRARSESSSLVDGDDETCITIEQGGQAFWWQIDLEHAIKIYRVKLTPSTKQRETTLNVSLLLNEKIPKSKSVHLTNEAINVFFEPPTLSEFITLETVSDETEISLCEVEVYGTNNLNELRGVLRSFTPEPPEPPDTVDLSSLQDSSRPVVPEFFHVMSRFARSELEPSKGSYVQTLEAYFMPNVNGNYSFKTSGEDEVTFIVRNIRDDTSSPIIKWDVSQTKNVLQGVFFEACVLYFMKATVEKLGENGLSLTAILHNTSSQQPNFEQSLFWILPGELQVDLSFENRGVLQTIVGAPTIITGGFQTRCLGFYCGYCPLAIFMIFANYIQCKLLANQTALNTGTIKINLTDWVLRPGYYDVKMAYRRNGNCTEIMGLTGPDVFPESELLIVGGVRVNPVVVVRCLFGDEICGGSFGGTATHEGWNRANISQDFSAFGFESSPHNSTSLLSFGWLQNTTITSVTGLCVVFNYKMSNSWETELSLSTHSASGTRYKMWRLFGVHGGKWNTAWVHLSIDEMLKFVFEVTSSKTNETVLISDVKVTTETCSSKINPYYAQIGHSCTASQFSCLNGECLKSSQRCDGETQCSDGSDEMDCDCLLGEFSCVSSKDCIALSNVCDGKNHCPDGSDERNCNFCTKYEFYCPSGKCVSWDSTCNDLWDCVDGSDEPNVCKPSKTGLTANKTCSLNNLGCLYDEQTNGSDCGYYQKCDFDNDWCGWSNIGLSDTFDWIANQGATLSEGTGPEVDHTTTSSRGSYINIESSPPRTQGDTARLLGGPFNSEQTVCLQFFYHMFGKDIGHLAVYKASSTNRTLDEILWRRSGEVDMYWHKALVTVYDENEFMIILEAGVGSGPLGDIAVDDIQVLRGPCLEKYDDEDILTCSFDEPCSWNGLESWKKSFHNVDSSSFFEGSFIYTEAPFSLTKTVSNLTTIPYQCVSFWHKHTNHLCVNTTISFSQRSANYKWSISVINTRRSNQDWRFTEIPLQQTSQEYTLSFKAIVNEDFLGSCLVAIDELTLTPEPCTSIKEGTSVLARGDSKFYHGIQTKYTEDIVAVFFKEPSPRFHQLYDKQDINQIVDNTPVNISQLSLGARVLVEFQPGFVVLGTVMGEYLDENNNSNSINSSTIIVNDNNHNNDRRLVNLSIRLDESGHDVSVANKTIWLLPVQKEDKGPIWRNPVKDCEGGTTFNKSCYKIVEQSNWFDAIDQCKSLGGSLVTINSLEEAKFLTGNFTNMSLIWLGDIGQFSSVVWTIESHGNIPRNGTLEKKGYMYANLSLNATYGNATLNGTLKMNSYMFGNVSGSGTSEKMTRREGSFLCPVFSKEYVLGVNCSDRLFSVCEIPVRQKHIMCQDLKKDTLECTDDGSVLEIHKAYIGQDVQELFKCVGYDVSILQNPCSSDRDMTKKTKVKCDGRRSCNINDSLLVDECNNLIRSFNVEFNCQANRTEDVVQKQPWCPYGYSLFESSCYKIPARKLTWQDAKTFCEIETSHIITINNKEEDVVLSSMMRSLDIHEVWIGLNDLAYKNLYQWLDRTKVGYSNWSRSDTENFDNGDHNCVVASDSGWMVKKCAEKMKFVCEYEPSQGSCDFKTDLCGWTNDPEQNSPGWRRQFQHLNRSIAFNISGGNISSLGNNSSHTNVPYPNRLFLYNNNTKPGTFTIASLLSPKTQSTVTDSHGVCLQFTFRLTGQQTELGVVINRKGMAGEPLWKVHGLNQSLAWKEGRVWLGIVSQFRVRLAGKLMGNNSMISITNILFKPGLCQALPRGAQEMDTHLSINTSGILTSPYYPSFYLNNMSRRWHLEASNSRRIRITFLYLNVEPEPKCKNDYVMIQDGRTSEKQFYFCGKTVPTEFKSSSNQLFIVFKSDDKIARTGFKIQYTVVKENEDDGCLLADVPNCPENCRCYRWPSDQSKISVYARNLNNIPSEYPQYTSAIFYEKNFFYKVTDGDFKNLPDLELLSLNENFISVIERGAFCKLRSLKTIRLSQNTITSISPNIFSENSSLEIVDFGGNWIQSLEPHQFSSLSKLRTLGLRYNKLTILKDGTINGLQNLKFLYFDENELSNMEENVFNETTSLEILHLQRNKLRYIRKKWLEKLSSLKKLKLNDNKIGVIESGSFDNLHSLSDLDLSGNAIDDFPEDLFDSLSSLKSLKVDHFTLCCYAEKALPSVSCTSLEDNGISSCDELLKNTVLKYSIWVLGVLAFAGNLGVILWRIIGKEKNRVNSFLLTHLAVADFLMGVYMLLIAYKDKLWDGVYFKHDISWRASDLCIFAGMISTISSEVSVFTLTLITFDRVVCIVFPFKFRRMSMKRAVYLTTLIWILGIALAIIPLMNDTYFYDYRHRTHFYGRSPVCLPFELSSEKSPGWEYSAFVFLGLNGTSFIFIVIAYLVMYRTITKAGNAVRSTRANQDSTLAKRMLFIILTDFVCWFPVIIISILALANSLHDPRKQVYAWIAVFVLPINSSINPLLYTFSTPLVRGSTTTKRATHSTSATMKSQKRPNEVSTTNAKLNTQSTTATTSTTKRPMKPSVLHRHQMLHDAYVDDDATIASSAIPEKTSDAEAGIENEDIQLRDTFGNLQETDGNIEYAEVIEARVQNDEFDDEIQDTYM